MSADTLRSMPELRWADFLESFLSTGLDNLDWDDIVTAYDAFEAKTAKLPLFEYVYACSDPLRSQQMIALRAKYSDNWDKLRNRNKTHDRVFGYLRQRFRQFASSGRAGSGTGDCDRPDSDDEIYWIYLAFGPVTIQTRAGVEQVSSWLRKAKNNVLEVLRGKGISYHYDKDLRQKIPTNENDQTLSSNIAPQMIPQPHEAMMPPPQLQCICEDEVRRRLDELNEDGLLRNNGLVKLWTSSPDTWQYDQVRLHLYPVLLKGQFEADHRWVLFVIHNNLSRDSRVMHVLDFSVLSTFKPLPQQDLEASIMKIGSRLGHCDRGRSLRSNTRNDVVSQSGRQHQPSSGLSLLYCMKTFLELQLIMETDALFEDKESTWIKVLNENIKKKHIQRLGQEHRVCSHLEVPADEEMRSASLSSLQQDGTEDYTGGFLTQVGSNAGLDEAYIISSDRSIPETPSSSHKSGPIVHSEVSEDCITVITTQCSNSISSGRQPRFEPSGRWLRSGSVINYSQCAQLARLENEDGPSTVAPVPQHITSTDASAAHLDRNLWTQYDQTPTSAQPRSSYDIRVENRTTAPKRKRLESLQDSIETNLRRSKRMRSVTSQMYGAVGPDTEEFEEYDMPLHSLQCTGNELSQEEDEHVRCEELRRIHAAQVRHKKVLDRLYQLEQKVRQRGRMSERFREARRDPADDILN